MTAAPTTDAAVLLRRLLEPAGVVAIKAAQQMAEDPNVPLRFRQVLEDLRDRNGKMTRLSAWKQALATVGNQADELKKHVARVGPTAGTGSIKQVFRTRDATGQPGVMGVLREGVLEQMTSTMTALGVLEDTKHLLPRVEPMLKREVDFRNEAAAFEAMRQTPIGQSPKVSVPRVAFAEKGVIVRESAEGDTIAAIPRSASSPRPTKPGCTSCTGSSFAARSIPSRAGSVASARSSAKTRRSC